MANGLTNFIDADYVKKLSYVDENVDEKYIKIAVNEAQQMHLVQIIGSGLYNEIETQIDANTLTALNTTLLQAYIAPALRYWTVYELMPFMLYKMTNKNISDKSSDGSQPISYNILDKQQEEIKNRAGLYSNKLKKYLYANLTSYPLFMNPGSTLDTIHPDSRVFDSGIFFGKNYDKNASYGERQDNPNTYGCD